MKKIFKSLIFPAISLLIVAIIYSGLSIENLNNQTRALQKQNETIAFNASNLRDELNQIQVKVEQTISLNSSLELSLTSAQKQIAHLQTKANTKASESSNSVVAQPAVITKIITQTVTQQVKANQATVTIENVGSFKVDLQAGDNAFTILQRAASQNNFSIEYQQYSFGVFVTAIANIIPTNNQYWAFYYNGLYSQVGASSQPVTMGDDTYWKLAIF